MGYLVAVLLVAVSVCAAFYSFVGGLGEALCENECGGPSNTPELMGVLALLALVGAVVVGTLAWRQDTTSTGRAGEAIFAAFSIASVGIVLGAVVLLIADPV